MSRALFFWNKTDFISLKIIELFRNLIYENYFLVILLFALSNAQNSVVKQFSTAFADVAEKAKPAVVTIITDKVVSLNQFDDFGFFFQPDMPRQREFKTNALGSGVIIDAKKGYILTNNHVVDDMDGIKVKLIDKREFDATIIGKDPKTDIAVLQIDAEDLIEIKLGNSDDVRVGEWVMAVGSPFFGKFEPHRYYRNSICTRAE